MAKLRIVGASFKHYKAFASFQMAFQEFNVLVGPNNSGKSTIIGAFRILAEGIRKARARNPAPIDVEGLTAWGHHINISELSVASENIFHEYDEARPAEIRFRLSNGNHLRLFFPEQGSCYLIPESEKRQARTISLFKSDFDVEIGFVPILGPVEQKEPLFQQEAARLALYTNRASRNFRNIWRHFPEDFGDFRGLVQATWPGMDIEPPEVLSGAKGPTLAMFCPEERHPREICWSGYGFQVWCQMLTYIVKARNASILVIDEPDIYLHADLQRQLVALLRSLGPDILIATHSTEIISEVDPSSLLTINKKRTSAQRVKNASQVKKLFSALGSNLNPMLTQLSKTRRAVFVEGLDFQILSSFARLLGKTSVANRSDFAEISIEGFNPRKVIDFSAGAESTIGASIARAVILDSDYRSAEEIKEIEESLKTHAYFVRIHARKELENYLLDVIAITAAISSKLEMKAQRTGKPAERCPDVVALLSSITEDVKSETLGQFLARRAEFKKRTDPHVDAATLHAEGIEAFEEKWKCLTTRVEIIPGKEVLARLNESLQEAIGISLTDNQIVSGFRKDTVPLEIRTLIDSLDAFCRIVVPER